jgi:serine/threonine protein phosphatase PrpC
MTFRLDVIASLSDAGKPGRPNEDRFGANRTAAFVLDGATGLGDRQFMTGFETDAAWIADYAAQRLVVELVPEVEVAELVRRISADARQIFDATAGEQPRYAWPAAALAGLRVNDTGLQFFGLGDSVVYLLHDDGRTETFTALPDAFAREQAAARAHLTRLGGIGAAGSLVGDPQTLEDLRASRAKQNTPDGWVWSLGLVPDAADHLAQETIPLAGGATAIICSDGLADLVSLYEIYDAGALIRRAATAGLSPLVAELRHLEREVDPDGLQYPRFKQSDDTTAILVRVEG